jgi:hypothetical protein
MAPASRSGESDRGSTATTEQLRHDIDQGLTGDKVRAPDSAAAPLGTDEEAAARRLTRDYSPSLRRRERASRKRTDPQRAANEFDWSAVTIWVVTVLGLALGVAAGLVLAP